MEIWEEYKKEKMINSNNYSKIYQVKDIKNGNYFIIKEINKKKYKDIFNKDFEEDFISKNVLFKRYINANNYYYIIMEKYLCNLEEYLLIREDSLSIEEIKDILIQINKYLIQNNKINLKLSNIVICLNKINKTKIKILNYKEEQFSFRNLGIIIYYMLFKSKNYDKNKNIFDEDLKDLMTKLINEKITFEDYFNHSFFLKRNKIIKLKNLPYFNFKCVKHSLMKDSYCINCKRNICNDCLNEHYDHHIISFEDIGLNDKEKEEINESIKIFENNIEQMKNNLKRFINQMKEIKNNKNIYENDYLNNYKKFYINYINDLSENLNVLNFIDLIDFSKMICEYEIKRADLKKEIRILNCYEEAKQKEEYLFGINNKEEILKNCKLYVNDEKKDFCFKFTFTKEGKYIIKIISIKPLVNINYMFSSCSSLISLNLSNFISNSVNNMSNCFYYCSSLTSLNLSNFKTNNVKDMSKMFSSCFSLKSLNLSNFNTINVTNMNKMFSGCYSLTSLNLSNFNTINVTNMSGMFSSCSSLKSLNLSNFKTDNVNNMEEMFLNLNNNVKMITRDEKLLNEFKKKNQY